MKKVLFTIILLVCSMLTFAVNVKIGNIRYALDETNKTAQVIKDNYSGDIVIPRSITYESNEYMVTSIYGGHGSTDMIYNYGAFYSCNLSSLTIPSSIKSIGGMAFYGCKIEKLYISDLNTWCAISFDIYQFHQCVELSCNPLYCNPSLYINGEYVEDLVIPEEITKISAGAFTGSQFKTVLLHKGIMSVSDDAFRGCSNLTDIYSYCPKVDESAFFVNDVNHQYEKTNVTLHIRERYSPNYNWTKIKETKYIDGIDYHLVYKIDGKEYKNVWYEVGEPITPEVEPTKEGYSFSGWSEIPETMPDHDVIVTGTFIKGESKEKCKEPIIEYFDGKLVVNCDTEGSECVTKIESDDYGEHLGNEIVVTATYNISAYAKAEGYANSDVVTATLCWIEVEGTPTIINEKIDSKATLVQSHGGTITVSGKELGVTIEVYDVTGQLIGSERTVTNTTTINTNLKPGDIALVKIGKKSVKIVIR